jgi:broad specificity phosphatase PhoE
MTPAGHGTGPPQPALPRTDRPDAPAYLTRYQNRTAEAAESREKDINSGNGEVPLYLRSFRARRTGQDAAGGGHASASQATTSQATTSQATADQAMEWQGEDLGVTRAWAEVTRTKEIVPQRRDQGADVVTDIYLVRHGETQGYSSESGLTPLGSWQSHRRGQEIARRVLKGHRVVLASAPTNRARQSAEHLRRGLIDNMVLFGRDAEVSEVLDAGEFRNFSVATPAGPRDVTAAFRIYHREMERYERTGLGERPGWLVEVDRFWGVQQGGGDPITHWLTMPLMYFEPPVSCVRRFWAGISRIRSETAGNTVVIATHSGPIRAFATWAMGYDPGEPFNAEFVRVRLIEGGVTALVLYRNRVQEVRVPGPGDLPAGPDHRFEIGTELEIGTEFESSAVAAGEEAPE